MVKVLPAVSELIDGHVDVADIRDVNEVDLLGRHQKRNRHRRNRRIPPKQTSTRNRRRRKHRLRTLPTNPPLLPRRADDARPPRIGLAKVGELLQPFRPATMGLKLRLHSDDARLKR